MPRAASVGRCLQHSLLEAAPSVVEELPARHPFRPIAAAGRAASAVARPRLALVRCGLHFGTMYVLADQHSMLAPRPRPTGPLLGASVLHRLDRSIPFGAFAVKYVLRGIEHYTVNGRSCAVGEGEYLLANATCTGHISIESEQAVLGLCADLPHALLDGMSAAFLRPEAVEEPLSPGLFTGADFPEDRYRGEHTHVGHLMQRLATHFHREPYAAHEVPLDTYLALAEALHQDHVPLMRGLQRIAAVRSGTRKDIFRRVERGRSYMHDMLHTSIDVQRVAEAAAMSEFHFFRAFRAIHGTTPHRYLRELRLQSSTRLLQQRTRSMAEIAFVCGFADQASFSKAFSKRFGLPPSRWQG